MSVSVWIATAMVLLKPELGILEVTAPCKKYCSEPVE